MRAILAAAAIATLVLAAGAGAAVISGSARPERVRGTAHADGIAVEGGGTDVVTCGRGRDVVTADAADRVGRDCETVSRALAPDPFVSGPAQHATEVEPDTFAYGSTVVAVYQVGRIYGGAAMAIGWSASTDAGRTWRSGRLPGVTGFSRPAGVAAAASDPSVTYDAEHGTWLVSSLAVAGGFTQLLISRSADARHWSLPVVAAVTQAPSLAYDKEWVVCDNGTASPFRGRCYLSYTDIAHKQLATQRSVDGGQTWSPATGAALELEDGVVGVQPATLPDGTLVVVFARDDRVGGIWAVRSRDGGSTFEPKTLVSDIQMRDAPPLREFPLPMAVSDGAGRIWATWHDCRFRVGCSANDVVLTSSTDGVTWTPPERVPAGSPSRSFLLPSLDAKPGSLAFVYYSEPRGCAPSRCTLSAHFLRRDGTRWRTPRRLTPQPIRMSWLPSTSDGRMVGDYFSVSWAGSRAVAVFVGAQRPLAGRLRERAFAYAG